MIIKRIILKNMVFLLSAAVLLTFISCPQPLSDDDVVAAQDDRAPTIVISSPSDSAIYYSSVDFTLSVKDDAESEEDNKGDLASISFDISNDDLRGGKVLIDPDGVQTQDDDFGPDEIVYDAVSGIASFSFSTIEPNIMSGLMSITIKAEDRNGNSTSETITLTGSEGPWLEYSITDLATNEERSYTEDTTVRIEGTIGNSEDDQESADQITAISWSVLGKAWSGTLEIDQNATYEDPDSGEILNYYNETLVRYERLNEGVVYPALFIYDPETRTFSTEIAIPFGAGTVLPFEVTVIDLNEHESTLTINAFSNESGPEIVINYPTNDSVAYYSGSTHNANAITGFINGGTADLASLKYSITDSTGDKTFTSGNIKETAFSGSNVFSVDIRDGLVAMEGTSDEIVPGDGAISVTLIAINEDNNESRPKVTLSEDSTGPSVSISSFVCDVGNSGYAKTGDSVTLSCTASDAVSGTSVSATGAVINGTGVTPSGLTATSSSWTGASDGNMTYSMTVVDHLNNATTVTQANGGSHQVMHYAGDPDYTHLEGNGLTSTDADTTYSGYAVAGEDIYVDMDFDRVITGLSNISTGSFTSSVTMNYGGDSSKARITLARSDAVQSIPANFSFDVTDAAGNVTSAGEGNSIDQGNVTGGVVIYDAVAPSAPSAPDLDNTDDTFLADPSFGTNADNITKNASGLTISGAAEAGSTVTLYRGGTTPIFSMVAAGGAWSNDISLSEGTYTLTARTVDPAGNVSPSSTMTPDLQIITTLPAAPSGIDLADASDSYRTIFTGTGQDDEITNSDSWTFNGNISSGGNLYLNKEDSPGSGTYTHTGLLSDSGGGNWTETFIMTGAAQGEYDFQAFAVDIAGNINSSSNDISVTRDTVNTDAPTISLLVSDDSGISNSDGITNDTSVTFTGTTTETDEHAILLSATHDVGGTPVVGVDGTSSSESGGTWTSSVFTLNSINDQNVNNITATSYDKAGNASSATPMELVLDTTAPTLSTLSTVMVHADSDTGISSSDGITNPAEAGDPLKFNIDVLAYDAGDKNPSASDKILAGLRSGVDGYYPEQVEISNNNTYELIINGVSTNQNIDIYGVIYDAAGNILNTAVNDSAVHIDTIAPADSISSLNLADGSDSGLSSTDDLTNIQTALSFTCTLSTMDENGYVRLMSNDGEEGNTTVLANATSASLTTDAGLSDASHTMTAYLYDTAGNAATGGASTILPIETDYNSPSEIGITAFTLDSGDDLGYASDDWVTSKQTALTFNITSTGSDDDSNGLNYWVLSDGVMEITTDTFITSLPASISHAFSEGTYNDLKLSLFDKAGNTGTVYSVPDTFAYDLITDYTDPTASLSSFALDSGSDSEAADGITNINTPLYNYNVSGVGASEEMYINLKTGGTFTAKESFTGNVAAGDINTGDLSDGTQTITATIYDKAGNKASGTNDQTDSITIDTVMNEDCSSITLNSDSGVSPSDGVTNDQDLVVTLSGAATEAYTVSFSSTGTGTFPDLAIADASSGPYSYTTATPDDGAHTISATMKDVAGNTSSPSDLVMTLDTVYPKLIGTNPIAWVNDSKDYLTITFTDDLDSSVITAGVTDDDMGELEFSGPSGTFLTGFNYQASFTTDYTVLKINAYNPSNDNLDDFAVEYSNILLDFTNGFTDTAGNALKKADGTTTLTQIQFDIDGSGVINIDTTGLGSLHPEITLASEEERYLSTNRPKASGYTGSETPTTVQPDKTTVTPDKAETIKKETVIPLTTRRYNDVVTTSLPTAAAPPPQTVFLPSVEEYNRINREALRFMEKVDETKQTHEELVEQIRMPGLSRESLKRMDSLLDPVIPEVEVLTIYSSPVPLAVETPVELAVEELVLVSEEAHPVSYLLIQILVVALISLITGLFLLAMKRLQRKE